MRQHLPRRLLALLAALTLTLSCAASAAFTDKADIAHGKAVEHLSTLHVLEGRTDGSFDPKGQVTRAEMAKIIAAVLLGGNLDFDGLLLEQVPAFPDTETHWALDPIRFCAGRDIISGQADGRFAPDTAVTGLETAKMLLVCVGYLPEEAGLTGADWEKAVRTLAQARGLLKELDQLDLAAPLTRDSAAQMVDNALGATMVYYDYLLTSVNGELKSTPLLQETKPAETILSMYFKTA